MFTAAFALLFNAISSALIFILCHSPAKSVYLHSTILSSLFQFIVQESRKDVALTSDLTVPVLTTLTALLRRGEGSLSNPHHVTIVLGAIEFVPLNQLPLPVYHDVFHAIHETLFAIIQCHPQVIHTASSRAYISTSCVHSQMTEYSQSTPFETSNVLKIP